MQLLEGVAHKARNADGPHNGKGKDVPGGGVSPRVSRRNTKESLNVDFSPVRFILDF